LERLKDLLKEKEYWTTKEAKNLIEIEFCIKQVLGMKYQKPYVNDFRKPSVQNILKKIRKSRY